MTTITVTLRISKKEVLFYNVSINSDFDTTTDKISLCKTYEDLEGLASTGCITIL